ncbi:NYN domain-containing protein [Arthrobacter sp. B1I2]|uniref:NYN domain-containing protein n=1 Tax=Arthrobacter sp. B1I2 TaxID=3042263 RepID=UPI0027D8C905|nr:NYN domain-containing protein [Arthrobacter sp. B1I2]
MPEASAITYTRPLTCHLIDIENEMGGGYWTAGDVELWWQIYRQQAVGITLGDLVIVGVAERAARKVRNGMRGENVKWRIGSDGPDGADLALLNAVNVSRISRRYSRLVVASGDHIFAPLAQEARVLGMSVQVVLGKGRVSRDLKEAATIQTRIRSSSREAQRRTLAAIRTVHAAAVAA